MLIGLTGNDAEAVELQAALTDCGVPVDYLIGEAGRPTTTKTRVIASHQQIVRVDEEETSPLSEASEQRALAAISRQLDAVNAVVISDYSKGFLTPSLLAGVMAAARQAGKLVLIDPKGADYARYMGASLLKPNRMELSILTGLPARSHEETLVAGKRLAALMSGVRVLVTEGADGMTLFDESGSVEHVTSTPRQVYDVTGAGDTVLATLSLAISAGASYREAMELASEAAAIAISTMGTATVGLEQLQAAVNDRMQAVC
jgi:D-beta-D-heptose 7-phosphate kinase/D-beta-D-heptose 1-phosphate adenosyltransferase